MSALLGTEFCLRRNTKAVVSDLVQTGSTKVLFVFVLFWTMLFNDGSLSPLEVR